MKLLFDRNLSPRLLKGLLDLSPGSVHARDVGLSAASDAALWNYAVERGLVIISKDADFRQKSFLLGHPPKVILVGLGNCSTDQIEKSIREFRTDIENFEKNKEASCLILRERRKLGF